MNCLVFVGGSYKAISNIVGFIVGGGSTGGTATGYTNGVGTGALFNNPNQLTIDTSGNLFIADASNNLIRKVVISSATATTIAGGDGTNVSGYANDTGTTANLYGSSGITYSNGVLYVSDTINHTIRTVNVTTGIVGTLAGGGNLTNATGTAAQFYNPSNTTCDTSGNIFVCDTLNHVIRKIDSSGVVTTLAGITLNTGTTNGVGTAARFNSPYGIVYYSGNLYVCDKGNNLIRQIVISSATVSTFAGQTTAGFADGIGTNATFTNLYGITADISGNLYIASDILIRKIAISGAVVTTLAGGQTYNISGTAGGYLDAVGTNALFTGVRQMAYDSNIVYLADANNNRIRKIDLATNTVTTFAGSSAAGFADGIGTNASFNGPRGICIDNSGNLYVSDTVNNKIRKITISSRQVTTVIGQATSGYVDGVGTNALLYNPGQLVYETTDGKIYFIDKQNCMIRSFDLTTFNVTRLAGQLPGPKLFSSDGYPYFAGATWRAGNGQDSTNEVGTSAHLFFPNGICSDGNGNLYFSQAYYTEDTIFSQDMFSYQPAVTRKINISTKTINAITQLLFIQGYINGSARNDSPNYIGINYPSPGGIYSYSCPQGIIYYNGSLYICDYDRQRISQYQISSNTVTTIVGTDTLPPPGGAINGVGTNVRLGGPIGMCSDNSGNIYIAENGNNLIRKLVVSSATVTTIAGGGPPTPTSGNAVGTGSVAGFNGARGITFDKDTNSSLYVADTLNTTVRKIIISTANVSNYKTGFTTPEGIVFQSGNLYITDTGTDTIRKIAGTVGTGVLTTYAGSRTGYSDAVGTNARFNNPIGVSTDGTNLYVSDTINNVIRKIVISTGTVTSFAGGAVYPGFVNSTGIVALFNNPKGACTDGTYIYVADASNNRIRRITISTGVTTTIAGSGAAGSANAATGTNATFSSPQGITLDSSFLYVCDTTNNMIRKVSTTGNFTVTTLAGSTTAGSTPGIGTNASFNTPTSIDADSSGNLYVTDTGNNMIRKSVISTASVTNFAGTGASGFVNGSATSAQFNAPRGIICSATTAYISDSSNNVIRSVTL